jgi:glutamyl-tRNA reductase
LSNYQTSQLSSQIFVLSIDYKSSPIEVREKFAFSSLSSSAFEEALQILLTEIGSTIILSTCNRTEFYFSSKYSAEEVKQKAIYSISELKKVDISLIREHLNFKIGDEAIEHLFRVSAGLESMILGEGQILNQLKTAYSQCFKYSDCFLNQLFQKALAVGKKVRAQTEIAKGAMSVPAAALQIIQGLISPQEISQKNIMILGSGQVAELCLDHLHSQGATNNITLVSRSESHTLLLTKYGLTKSIDYTKLQDYLYDYDIILACTNAPHYIIKPEYFELKNNKKFIICDMTLPRNVDPKVAEKDFIKLIDLDYLQNTVKENATKRSGQIQKAETLISLEMKRLQKWLEIKSQQYIHSV